MTRCYMNDRMNMWTQGITWIEHVG